MPKRDDIESILLIGSGPIVIGQACEFDYSGTQACKVLRAEGYRVILVNSNPATIMTDPEFADATYIEPLDLETLTAVIARERPDALLPTLGGQTALNLAIELDDAGVLKAHDVELIGASVDAIRTAEDRQRFKAAMEEIGLAVPPSGFAYTVDEALEGAETVGYPLIVRPSFILGGGGTGIAADAVELHEIARVGLDASPILVIASRNSARSSALSIASAVAPIISTSYFSSVPIRRSESAQLSAVCPPIVGSSAKPPGMTLRSISMMRVTISGVIGSM